MVQPEGTGPQSQPSSAPSGRAVSLAAMVVLLVAAVLMTLRLTETWPFATTPSSVEEALDYVPYDATFVEIHDQRRAEQRLGIDDIETGASGADLERYLEVARDNRAAREELLREGTEPLTGEPIADVLEVESMTVDGARVTIDYTFEQGASALPSAVAVRNLPPTLCFPL